ncbi:hypothetical protein Zmor_026937 [Zophobas morio]|uniref:Uncharacterized protein n=1 Tax=Zophobas morio TaxID=2755281 RepID=A0AA38M5K0_9CUCU|nr:hypothetical protein Zmor_026937 [Zophobas morio]
MSHHLLAYPRHSNPIRPASLEKVVTKGPTILIAGYPRFKLAVSFRETAALPWNPADSSRAHDTSSINCFIVTFQSPNGLSAQGRHNWLRYIFSQVITLCASLLSFRISAIFMGWRRISLVMRYVRTVRFLPKNHHKPLPFSSMDMNMIGVLPPGVLFKSNKYSVT